MLKSKWKLDLNPSNFTVSRQLQLKLVLEAESNIKDLTRIYKHLNAEQKT